MLSEDGVIYNRTGFKGGHVMVDTCSYSPLLRFEDGIPFHFSLFHFVGRPFLWPALKPVRVQSVEVQFKFSGRMAEDAPQLKMVYFFTLQVDHFTSVPIETVVVIFSCGLMIQGVPPHSVPQHLRCHPIASAGITLVGNRRVGHWQCNHVNLGHSDNIELQESNSNF